MRQSVRAVSSFALLVLLASCASAADGKGEEENLPGDGKGDSFASAVDHGTLRFGTASSASITRAELFHAWTFELTDDAKVELRTEQLSANLDTVMYLYRRDPGADRWGRYVAKNDDADGEAASALEDTYEAGEYRVLVKSFKSTNLGDFDLASKCSGSGCPAAAAFPTCDSIGEGRLPDETSFTESCGYALADLLTAHIQSESSAASDGTCDDGDPVTGLATAYYYNYWFDLGESPFEDDEEVSYDVDTTSLGDAGYIVRVNDGGDESAIDFYFDVNGKLLVLFQDNQSPTVMWFCGGRSEADLGAPDEACVGDYLTRYPHRQSAESEAQDEVDVDAIPDLGEYPYALQLALADFAADNDLSAGDRIAFSYASWQPDSADSEYVSATFTAPDETFASVMVGDYTEDRYFEFGRSTEEDTTFRCETKAY